MKRSLRESFKNLRQSFYQAQVEARQAGAFIDNPFTFSWRLVREFGTNWLNSEKNNQQKQAEDDSTSGVKTEQTDESKLTLTLSNKQYTFTVKPLIDDYNLQVFFGTQSDKKSDQTSFHMRSYQAQPVLLQKIDEAIFNKYKQEGKASNKNTQENQNNRLLFEDDFLELSLSSSSQDETKKGFYVLYQLSGKKFKCDDKSPLLLSGLVNRYPKNLTCKSLIDILQCLDNLNHLKGDKSNRIQQYQPLSQASFLIAANSKNKVHLIFWHYSNLDQHKSSQDDNVQSVIGILKGLYFHQNEPSLQDNLKIINNKDISFQQACARLQNDSKIDLGQPIFKNQGPDNQPSPKNDKFLSRPINWLTRQNSQVQTTKTEDSPPTSSPRSRRRSKSRPSRWKFLFWVLSGLTLVVFVIPIVPRGFSIAEQLTEPTPPPNFQACFPNTSNSSPYPCLMRNQARSSPGPATIIYGDVVEHIFGNEEFKRQFEQRTGQRDWSWINTASPEAPEMDDLDDAALEITVVSPNSSENLSGDGGVIGYDGLAIFGRRSTSRILDDQISKAELVEVLNDINNRRFRRNVNSLGLNLPRNRPTWENILRTSICSDADCPLTRQSEPGEAQDLRGYVGQILKDKDEDEDATVGVAPLSFVKTQCKIYSIAIEGQHPLVNFRGQALTSETELCDQKGGYWPDLEKLTTLEYPLSYAIVVRASPGQELLAEELVNILRTDEGQSLLRGFGLTPCRFPNGDETQERCQLQ